MQIKSASKSGIETYGACAFSYYLSYILKIPSPSGKSATLGVVVHKVMELLAKRRRVVKHLKKSNINNPNFLLKIAYKSITSKEKHIQFEDADYRLCQKCLTWLMVNGWNPMKQNVVDAEKNFLIDIQRPGFKYKYGDDTGYFSIKGIIDLVVEEPDGTLHIIDYKTGKYISDWASGETKSEDDFKKDLQLRMYFLAARLLYPSYEKYRFSVVYCALGKTMSVSFSDADEAVILDQIRRHYKKISSDDNPKRLKDDSTKNGLHWRCFKLCHYGVSGLCDKIYKDINRFGQERATAIHKITVSAKGKKRLLFEKTGVIK